MGMPYSSSLSLEDMLGLLRPDIGDRGCIGDAEADDIGDRGVEGMLEEMRWGGGRVGGEECKLGVCC